MRSPPKSWLQHQRRRGDAIAGAVDRHFVKRIQARKVGNRFALAELQVVILVVVANTARGTGGAWPIRRAVEQRQLALCARRAATNEKS